MLSGERSPITKSTYCAADYASEYLIERGKEDSELSRLDFDDGMNALSLTIRLTEFLVPVGIVFMQYQLAIKRA